MTISAISFASTGHFATYDPFATEASRITIFKVQCRCCGYEPEDALVAPRTCPKCHSQSWERFARPGSILENASRY